LTGFVTWLDLGIPANFLQLWGVNALPITVGLTFSCLLFL